MMNIISMKLPEEIPVLKTVSLNQFDLFLGGSERLNQFPELSLNWAWFLRIIPLAPIGI
jgi:hypothetical protein